MKAVKIIALSAVGVAALVGAAAPAAAQFPGYGYGSTSPVNVIGQVLQTVLNPYAQNRYAQSPYANPYAQSPYANPYAQNPYSQYGGYGANHQRVAAQQCATAVQQRLGGGYAQYGHNNAYNQARVLGITRIEQRSRSTLRVRGYATSGMGYGSPYGGGYGGYGGYAQAQAPADLSFSCDVDYRGYIRDIDIDRRRY
jgi:hypothetical protein